MTDRLAATGAPGVVDGPGALEPEGTQARVTFRRLLRHPIDEVWAAITDPKQIESWSLAHVRREDVRGGRIEMEHPGGLVATGRVLEWNPPRVYEYEWNLPPDPHQPAGEASVVRYELSEAQEGTLLVLTHRRLSRARAEIFVRGLSVLLDRLSAALDSRPMPEPPWARAARAAESSR